MVERGRARHLAEPGAGRAALRVDPVPEPQRALERLGGELLGRRAIGGEPREVAVHVVEVVLGSLGERQLTPHASPVENLLRKTTFL